MRVEDRFEQLATEVLAAERALSDRRNLPIAEPAILATYERRLVSELPLRPFRLRAVHALLARARRIAQPRRIQALAPAWPRDRLYAARAWGIDLRPVEPGIAVAFDEYLWKRLVTRLASDLTSLGKIEQHFAMRDVGELTVVSDGEGAAFEQLVLDLLNDGFIHARQATLYEDFLEKTDLRVQFDGLDRKNGARVQVSMSTSDEVLNGKRSELRHADEYVVLSPRSIAAAIVGDAGLASSDLLQEVHSVLGTVDAPVGIVARSLRSLLVHAIRKPGDDLRGPVAQVPACVRTVIQTFVIREALEAANALRTNEARRRSAA